MADSQLLTDVRALVGRDYGRVYAWDEVNAPMIRQCCGKIQGLDGCQQRLWEDQLLNAISSNCLPRPLP